MDNTIILQGRFTSTGATKVIPLRSGVDWMKVYNLTIASGAQTTAIGVEYMWRRGFADGAQWIYKKSNAANAANLSDYVATGGFTYVDTTTNPLGPITADITAVSNAAIPVVTTTGLHGFAAGDVCRIYDVAGAQQIGGMDFTVGNNTLAANTFSLDYMPQIVAGTTGSWRKVKWQTPFYPTRRYITKITQAAQAVVTMSVTHGYKVGQAVRFTVPAEYGMIEMNELLGTIVAIDTTATTGNSITVNINSTAFTPFAFPVTAIYPHRFAEVVPVGENTASALFYGVDAFTDATIDQNAIVMVLGAGANCPAGANGNVIYWEAGVSFSVDNT
jgi:hypothetical protein